MAPTAAPAAPNYTTSAEALQGLQGFQAGMKSPQDILKTAQDTSGATQAQQQVSGLQGAIANTTGLLNRVAPDIMGRTGNSLVTNAQADAQIANASAPINATLTQQQQDEQTQAQQLAADQTNAENLANAEITGQQTKLGNIQSIYDALLGRETAAQNQANFESQQAAAAKSASSGSGSGTKASSAAPTIDDYVNYINQLRQSGQLGDSGYGSIAQYLQSPAGGSYDITRDTPIDRALRKAFGFDYQAN